MSRVVTFDAAADLDATPEQAFRALAQVERWSDWQAGVRRVVSVSGAGDSPGTTFVLDHGPKMKLQVTILEAVPGVRYRFLQRGIGSAYDVVVTFAAIERGRSRARFEVAFEAPLGLIGWISTVTAKPLSSLALRREVSDFKRFAEESLKPSN